MRLNSVMARPPAGIWNQHRSYTICSGIIVFGKCYFQSLVRPPCPVGVYGFLQRVVCSAAQMSSDVAASMEAALPTVTDLTWGQMADRVIMTPGVMYGDLMAGAMNLTGKGGTCG